MAALVDKYLELVKDYKWSPLFCKWALLTSVSSLLERKCYIDEAGLGFLYPNLYVVFVGPPAAKKTSCAKFPVDRFVATLDKGPIFCSSQLTPASLIDELESAGKLRYEFKTSPLFAIAGEFEVWFKDIGGGEIVDLLLDFWDSRYPGEMWVKNTKKWGKQILPNPALTLLGCTTPQAMMERRIVKTAGVGFISRVIFVCEPGNRFGATRFPELNNRLIAEISSEFIRMNSISGRFTLGPGTEDAQEEMIIRCQKWIEEHPGTNIMETYFSRKPAQVRKLSMILCAMRNSKKIILPEDVFEAEALLNELEPTMPDAFGVQVLYQDAGLAAKILSYLTRGIVLDEDQLFSNFFIDGQALASNYEFQAVIGGLVKSGRLTKEMRNDKAFYKRKV